MVAAHLPNNAVVPCCSAPCLVAAAIPSHHLWPLLPVAGSVALATSVDLITTAALVSSSSIGISDVILCRNLYLPFSIAAVIARAPLPLPHFSLPPPPLHPLLPASPSRCFPLPSRVDIACYPLPQSSCFYRNRHYRWLQP
ncbi:hypothetical protein BHE74_00031213 [Ensete ventricosum]|nr:hypothetical protein BHE74_00031213 [Ensete ventricosum]